MQTKTFFRVLLLLFTFILSACSEDDIVVPADVNDYVDVSECEVSLSAKSQYYTIRVTPKKEGLVISLESDVDWITLDNNTLPSDGYVEFLVSCDEDGVPRDGNININVVDETGNSMTTTCKVSQCDRDSLIQLDPGAAKSMRVGYGYNIFGHYMNEISVMNSILADEYLLADNNEMVETSPYSYMDVDKVTAHSLTEMGHILTEKEEKNKSGLGGASKTTKVFTESQYTVDDCQFVHLTLRKSVAMRSIDIGVMTQKMELGEQVFSEGFRNIREKIIANPSSENVKEMLKIYGTHLVVYAESGLSIELAVNFRMMIQGSLNMRAEDFSDYFFRNKTSEFLTDQGKIADMTSDIKVNENCIIAGGSEESKEALKNEITKNGRPSEATLFNFLASVDGSSYQNAIPIRFQMIPIWDLFPSSCLGAIITEVNNLSTQTNNKYKDSDLGTDYYKISLTRNMLDFGTSGSATLVKTVRVKDASSSSWNPILEICNEYVPKVRGDKRITVIYGLRNGRPFHGAGFFPGDGEGNPPAWLTFSGSDVYVLPIETETVNDKITKLYYLHGHIYMSDYGTKIKTPASINVSEEYLQLAKKYPIVKIGSGYWTRCDMKEEMMFGKPINPNDENSRYIMNEKLIDGVLYANIHYNNAKRFLNKYPEIYGADTDYATGIRTKWYVPQEKNIRELYSYIGKNAKALFANNPSGFEANFLGMNGSYDDIYGNAFGSIDSHYKNEYCFIACKNGTVADTGMAMILSKDYRLFLTNIKVNTQNNYPVRLFRTSYFSYK